MSKILIADDEERIRDIIRQYLEFEGFEYGEAGDGVEAFEKVKTGEYDLVVLDVMMPKSDGITHSAKDSGNQQHPGDPSHRQGRGIR